jgi:Domain of unknown function (DUF4112)
MPEDRSRDSTSERVVMSDYPITPSSGPQQDQAPPSEPLKGEVLFGPPPGGPPELAQQPVLAMLDLLSFVMDRLFEVPGTKVRVGLNTLLLLVPVLGDAFSSAVNVAILTIGLSVIRVPRIVAARMMMNSLIDSAIGWIPVVGDLFNLWFKANTRNVRLLMEYAGQGDGDKPSTLKHWLWVIGMGLAFVLILALLVLGVWWFLYLAIHGFQGTPAPPAAPPPA